MTRKKQLVPRKRLIELRGQLSQTEMALVFGLKQQTYAHYETGYSTPPPAVMKAMENHFDVPMEELFPDAFNSKMENCITSEEQQAI